MQIQTNGDSSPVQLTEISNFSPDGTLLSKSLNLTLRNESVGKVWRTYLELKKLIGGEANKPKRRTKKETQKEKENTENENPQKKAETCPECGGMLVEKSGISSKNGRAYHFIGCANWPICNFTKPFLTEKEKKRLESMPADQDLMVPEEVPF